MKRPLSAVIESPDFEWGNKILIEASAGTGKTYCIQTMFLRLILEQGFSVDRIIVVTFTNAATAELRERLRSILQKTALFFKQKLAEADPDYSRIELISRLKPLNQEQTDDLRCKEIRVRRALLDFDSAAIFTIHGFCQKILQRYAFESGQETDLEMVGDSAEIMQDAARDWWRKNIFPAPESISYLVRENRFDPDKLAKAAVRAAIKPEAELIPAPLEPKGLDALFDLARRSWDEAEIVKVMSEADLNKTKIKKPLRAIDACKFQIEHNLMLPPLEDLSLLRSSHLKTLMKKSSPRAPEHKFFQVCEDLVDLAREQKGEFLSWAVAQTVKKYQVMVKERRLLTYSGLLFNLRQALRDERKSPELLKVLRADFDAALIDEFQDTDPVQYEIFQRIFGLMEKPLILVGDPKQAIYSFRDGDIYTYYSAAAEVESSRQFSLDTNYRSEPRLVEAINLLFGDSPSRRTFLNDQIEYPGLLKSRPKPRKEQFLVKGQPDLKPFKLWKYTSPDSKLVQALKTRKVYADMAVQISDLLGNPEITIGDRRLCPSDIAILVMKHQEAREIREQLKLCRIRSVLQSMGNIFDSPQAYDFALLVKAMYQPGKHRWIRAALLSDLFACSPSDLSHFYLDPFAPAPAGESFSDYLLWFHEAGEIWKKKGFIHAFNYMFNQAGSLKNLLDLPEGERKATNFLHLSELTHQYGGGWPEETLDWMNRQLNPETREKFDEFEIRLDRDDDAVKIMTVFKSKGLQFPIVFIPTMWMKAPSLPRQHRGLEYHDRDFREGRPVIDLRDKEAGMDPSGAFIQEAREEQMRMLYVACTRAANQTYLVCDDGSVSAPGELLSDRIQEISAPQSPVKVAVLDFQGEPKSVKLPVSKTGSLKLELAGSRYGEPEIELFSGPSSFSSLAQQVSSLEPEGRRDFDAPDIYNVLPQEDLTPIFAFPAGARTGQCWHAILEELDFTASFPEAEQLVARKLDLYGFLPVHDPEVAASRLKTVTGMIMETMSIQLQPAGPVLREVGWADRISELEFNYSLRPKINSGNIVEILRQHWGQDKEKTKFLERLRGWDQVFPPGFMTGFIDLVFRWQGRYYLLDWKSNRINSTAESFDPQGIEEEMSRHAYFLQYLIYVTALHGYLGQRLVDYDYDRDFGGVFYVFLRGIDGNVGQGVYGDRPPRRLIEDLNKYLIPGWVGS